MGCRQGSSGGEAGQPKEKIRKQERVDRTQMRGKEKA